ncbi:putative N-acetylmannosamine-6-phosphate 2-epimerase [Rhodovastum atsumiense]|uniref:N-acylglucosamine-6-phosphate 2-epimerase n=1 Tax=Rhodovastum atsumiense TaxID=504468 RepID=A0A5M6IME5_9PROT|nr:putative N-acetylmannosamine-6-phosphate 2-epimerase [Rhodovastum atsumiense]KAA5609117.1 putative N-acetylmannosamine-6-phosphate 2-epimerase [Rhodovastum atsumiense]CAH2603795.1 putative N-acetylmannosamine-6-phosphate 2-epimerase [Rhodovastum atsumiense]
MIPRGALIVSCQARTDHPLHGPTFMAAMARAAQQGGAQAIRCAGPMDVAAIRATTTLPIIGLFMRFDQGFHVTITPDFESAYAVAEAGADIIALDATARARRGEPAATLIRRIRGELGHEVLADVSTLEEALAAERAGATWVATTLAGYTDAPVPEEPDFNLLEALVAHCRAKVVAEGRYRTPAQVARAFAIGAHAVCVGTAITDPRGLTQRFVAATPR